MNMPVLKTEPTITLPVTPAEVVRLKTLKVEEPPKRKGGVKLKTVAELVDKLRNEAGVI